MNQWKLQTVEGVGLGINWQLILIIVPSLPDNVSHNAVAHGSGWVAVVLHHLVHEHNHEGLSLVWQWSFFFFHSKSNGWWHLVPVETKVNMPWYTRLWSAWPALRSAWRAGQELIWRLECCVCRTWSWGTWSTWIRSRDQLHIKSNKS